MPPDSGIRDDSSDRPFARPRGNCSAILDRGRRFCAGWRRSVSSQSSMEIKRATASDSARIEQLLIDVRKRFMPYAPSPHSDAQIQSWVAQFLVPSGGGVLALAGDAMLGATATAQERGSVMDHADGRRSRARRAWSWLIAPCIRARYPAATCFPLHFPGEYACSSFL
jgi:hypothetical protein